MRRRFISKQENVTPLSLKSSEGFLRFSYSEDIYYRNNAATEWIFLPKGTSSPSFSIGDTVRVKGNSAVAGKFTALNNASWEVSGDPRSLLSDNVITEGCFRELFKGTYVKDASRLELHSMNLAPYCYYGMFEGCTNLVNAPELPAQELKPRCYMRMFRGCTRLKYVEIKALDISPIDCLNSWMYGVPSGGTIVMNKDANWKSVVGVSGRPSGWTVIYQ
jgi:hypothetical protein